jgi:hypothetical protein
MTWLKLDDALWRHPKVAALAGDPAIPCIGLWCLCLAWVGANLTDGFIPDRGVVQVAGRTSRPSLTSWSVSGYGSASPAATSSTTTLTTTRLGKW